MADCIQGQDGVVKIGVLAVGKVKAFNIDVVADVGETTNFDSLGWAENCALINSWSGTLDVVYITVDLGQDLLVIGDELAATEFNVGGVTAPGVKHSGTIIVTGINHTSITGSVVEQSISFVGTGVLTTADNL